MDTKQTQTNEILKHPFPQKRPNVKIVESGDRISEMDCPELQWWFAVPEMGESHFRAEYDANTLELDAILFLCNTGFKPCPLPLFYNRSTVYASNNSSSKSTPKPGASLRLKNPS